MAQKDSKALLNRYAAYRRRAESDFEFFARNDLLIDVKGGGRPVPFVLNRAQRYVMDRLNVQRDSLGFIRANILKGRQQGMSTMVAALFFHQCITRQGVSAIIISKDARATRSVFGKIKRFATERSNLITTEIPVGTCNLEEVTFLNGSSISCQTARADNVARGGTFNCVHLSEVPYWEHAEEQVSSIMDSVARAPGTIIILESTAKGRDVLFYENYQLGLRGISDWQSIFVPWYWQEEYSIPIGVDENFEMLPTEQTLATEYGLSREQVKWRRYKLYDYKRSDPIAEWNREYPMSQDLAFESTVRSEFFDMQRVWDALSNQPFDCDSDQLLIGVDIGGGGSGDPSIACFRQGVNVLRFEECTSASDEEREKWCLKLIRTHRPTKMYVDYGAIAMGLVQRLQKAFPSIVVAVSFGGSPDDLETYANKRAEMADRLRHFFSSSPCHICRCDALVAEMQVISAIPDRPKLTLIDKKTLKRSIGRSTDNLDALMLTFSDERFLFSEHFQNSESVTTIPHPPLAMHNFTKII